MNICTYIVHCNKINNLEVIILLHYLWNSSKIFIHAIHFFNPFLCWNIQKKAKVTWQIFLKRLAQGCSGKLCYSAIHCSPRRHFLKGDSKAKANSSPMRANKMSKFENSWISGTPWINSSNHYFAGRACLVVDEKIDLCLASFEKTFGDLGRNGLVRDRFTITVHMRRCQKFYIKFC